MIVASPFAQFDGSRFYDSDYVRAYRRKILDYIRSGNPGFGVRFSGEVSNVLIDNMDGNYIRVTYSIGVLRLSTALWVDQCGNVVQNTEIRSGSCSAVDLDYTLDLGISVNRASFGQLTEGGPIPIPLSRNETKIYCSGYQWAIINENLDAIIEGAFFRNGQPVCIGKQVKEIVIEGGPIREEFRDMIQVLPDDPYTLTATFILKPGTLSNPMPTPLAFCGHKSGKEGWKMEPDVSSFIVRRNIEYILCNCAFPVGSEAICFVTDHVALPLGWNRDN